MRVLEGSFRLVEGFYLGYSVFEGFYAGFLAAFERALCGFQKE